MLTPQTQTRVLEILDEMSAAHDAALNFAADLRALVCLGLDGSRGTLPHINKSKLAVEWNGKTCFLKNSVTFRLMDTLCRRPGHVFSHTQLIHNVWSSDLKSADTIRSTVRHLKHKLKQAGMHDLANAVRTRGHGYCLSL